MTIQFTIAAALVVFSGIFTVVGCVSQVEDGVFGDACNEANAKMSSCFVDTTTNLTGISASASASAPDLTPRYVTQASSFPSECNGLSLCEASCINSASCDQLKDGYSEKPSAASDAHASCLAACSASN